jgi:TonB-dependent receptor
LSGRVVDSAGAVLPGARVVVGQRSTVSDALGQWTVANLPPGSQQVDVSYVGFAAYSAMVNLEPGQAAKVEVVLKPATRSEDITVYAERQHGEAEAINRERSSDNILQVLPAEVITSLPNTNVADAIGRLPSVTLERDEGEGKYVQIRGTEPRLSNVTINGITVASPEQSGVRQVKLDIIPADLVESVEINKTLSANQDGNAIGGSVNLVTKTAGEAPTLTLGGMGGYTPIFNGRSLTQFDGTLGKRFGANKKWGVLFGGSYDWNGRGINDIEPSLSSVNFNGVDYGNYNGMDLREYQYYRARYGFTGSVDYKINDGSSVYLRSLYSHFNNFGSRWVYSPAINSFTSPTQGGPDGSMSFNSQIRRPVEVIGSLLVGGKHTYRKSWLSWNVSISRSAQEDQGYAQADFGANDGNAPINNVQFGLGLSNPLRPQFVVQNGVNIYEPSQYYIQDINFNRGYGAQLNLEGDVSYARNYSVGGHFGTFELGGKLQNAHKFNDARYTWYDANTDVPTPQPLQMTNFVTNLHDNNYYDKSYKLGPLTDFDAIRSFFNSTPGLFAFNFDRSKQRSDPNNYDLVERVPAGYAMNTIEFGRVRLQTGVRFEATQEDNLGYIVKFNGHTYVSTTPNRRTSSVVDVLPSVQARIRLGADSALRLVYSRGLSRPNFGDLVPFVHENDRSKSISIGNPNLKNEHANNFDILFEQYLKPLGMLQAGFFYKDISDPLVAVQTAVASGTYTGFQQTQTVNAGSAHVTGFEIGYQQHLGFLPGRFSGLGISANYSYTSSGTSNITPGRSDHPALTRQAPNTWNVSPTFDRGRLSLRVGISHNDANIFYYNYQDGVPLGLKGPNGDQYLYAHTQVDAQGSFRMYRGLKVVAYGLDLTNEVFGFYQGSPQWTIQREYYKPTFSAGLRWTSGSER